MNYPRVALAGLTAAIAYFAAGFVLLAVLPLTDEIRRFADVYRPQESMQHVARVGMAALLLAMMALAALYALVVRDGSRIAQGVRFGLLVGVVTSGSFVLHNYVSLNIGLRLALLQAFAYFVQWAVAGVVIALIYKTPFIQEAATASAPRS